MKRKLLKVRTSASIEGMLKRRDRAGISLIELMIAIAVIVVGMSGVAASLYFGFAKSRHGDDIATATQYSRMLIEIGAGRNFVDQNLDAGTRLPSSTSGMNDTDAEAPRALDAPPYDAGDFLAYPYVADGDEPSRDLGKFTRKIQMQRVGAKGTPEEFLARITVTLYWDDKGAQRSVSTSAILPIVTPLP